MEGNASKRHRRITYLNHKIVSIGLIFGCFLAGAITAALFLKQFVLANTQWAHVDIAGPAFDSEKGLGTGFAAATLAQWVLAQARSR